MELKMETLKTKHTWDLVELPPGANIMDSKWVYDIKWVEKPGEKVPSEKH